MAELNFDRLPPALPAFGKVAMARGAKSVELKAPMIATADSVQARKISLAGYRRVCGIRKSDVLPICYPQVMSFPLHMHLLGHPDFPLSAMGLVHVSNRIEQHQPLPVDDKFDVVVEIAKIDKTTRGYEFELVTEFQDDSGNTLWRGVATILSRRDGEKKPAGKKPPAPQPSSLPELAQWTLKSNLGRRYAMVSGDVNPIHLSAPTARLLGFKRAIIHGMWTQAKAAADLPVDSNAPCTLAVEFKTPLFLPGQAKLHGEATDDGFGFEVKDAKNHKPILNGSLIV